MGRGGYDTTDPGNPKSAMAAVVLKHESDKKKEQETANAKAAAMEALEKLKRNKKSRGIRDAQRAMRNAAGTQT